jgi:tetratricopeptide (TPR) repeat protein
MLTDFPGDSYATGQLAKITTLRNQQELEKKNEAETNKLVTQANTLKTSKKYDEAISKLQQAIALAPSKKDEINKEINAIKAIQSDILLEADINKNFKIASDLLKDKKYDDAIKTYKAIDQSIIKLSNQPLVDKYSNLSKQGSKSVIDKKKQEGEEFKKQLKKAQDNFDKGPAFYGEAEKILKGDPMKSRMNDPDVKKLSESILKMKDFYKQKSEAYKEVISKTNNASALTKLKSARNVLTKLGTIAPSSELSILTKSIDSLETILNPNKNSNQNSNKINLHIIISPK